MNYTCLNIEILARHFKINGAVMGDTGNFRILVIDDNPAIHTDFIKILSTSSSEKLDQLSEGIFGEKKEKDLLPKFQIDVASQGKEGVERIKEALNQGWHYSLAFVDIRMPPGWDGVETIKHIWELDKNVQIVICTAYSDYSWEETVSHLGQTDNLLVLKKPFDNIAVRQLACALTMKWQLAENARQYTKELQQQVANKTLSLQESLSLVKSTFESSSDGILVVNLKEEIIDYNQKLLHMLEISSDIIDLKSEAELLNHIKNKLINADEFFDHMQALHTQIEEVSTDEIKFTNGKIFECYSQPHTLNNKIVGRILAFQDITKGANLEKELLYQATHDALTGLQNRVKLLERIRLAIKLADENKLSFALMFLDLDRFKLINDSLSHSSGDDLLQILSKRLQAIMRSEDTLARLGGDEFVILFMNISKEEHIKKKIDQILSVFQEPFPIDGRKIMLCASIGISLYPKDATTVEMLLRNADTAMYAAKARKGNHFEFYSPEMSAQSLAELDQEADLRHAIVNHEFFLNYQPQIALENNKLVAVEALIRWQHPKKGVLLPIDFIALAEETGLIVPIGEWVMRTACQQNKAWQDAGLPPMRVAVNIASQQFKQPDLVDKIHQILNETKLDAKYLELELTENVIVGNRETIRLVAELKKLGVSITVDDFGSGYSSLGYLHKIQLDRLKIDSSFIQHIQSTTDDEVIVRAMFAMAKSLNLDVIAEGVETKKQLDFLKQYQYADAQGFYFSKPLSKNEIENLIQNPSLMHNIKPVDGA